MRRLDRRNALLRALAGVFLLSSTRIGASAPGIDVRLTQEKRWFDAADAMRRLAESWGDQSYGAVLVAEGTIIGEGPSRVVRKRDPTAHAEREAIRDAQRRLGRADLAGSVLYSTSRPCRECERAAAEARVARMIYGAELKDAGRPRR